VEFSVYRLMSKGDGYLFASLELRQLTEGIRAAVSKEVDGLDVNRVLNTAPADLTAYLVDKYRIDPVVLHRDQMHATDSECKVDVSRDRNRMIGTDHHRGPLYINGQRIRVVIPFEGDGELFYCRAGTFTSSPPRGGIEQPSVVLTWDIPHDAPRDLKSEIESAVKAIEQHLLWVSNDVSAFNGSLPQVAAAAIEDRRKRLLANQGRLANLGIPVRARADAPTTIAAPNVRRKVVPTLPAASTATYTPEPALDTELYDHILKVTQNMTHVMERSPSAFASMDEETLRQHFLVQLNGHFEGQATGETFNAAGKTDILLRSGDRNVFIAECKFWNGPKQYAEAIDQLLSYASWRDSKTAIFVFNRSTSPSTVLTGVRTTSEQHGNYKRTVAWPHESGFRFVFHHPGDKNRELTLTVLVFDIPKPS
jgi:hypothetical protein